MYVGKIATITLQTSSAISHSRRLFVLILRRPTLLPIPRQYHLHKLRFRQLVLDFGRSPQIT